MKRLIFSSFFGLYFFSSVVNNIATEENVFNEFFYGKSGGIVNSLFKRAGSLASFFTIFSEYTGSETGFGLYAPQVSSQIVIYFSIKDEAGQIVKTLQPNYTSKEVLLRFYTVYGTALNKLSGQGSQETDEGKLFDVVLKSLAFKILMENPSQTNIDADVYVYELPMMRDYPNDPEITYTHLFHYEYSLPKNEQLPQDDR